MKRLAMLIFAAALLAGCGEKKYDYRTFSWPNRVDQSVMMYWDSHGAEQSCTNLNLDEILDKAQDLGWQYAGSVGNTCIMRRPQRHTTGLDMTGEFVVEASSN